MMTIIVAPKEENKGEGVLLREPREAVAVVRLKAEDQQQEDEAEARVQQE